MTRSRFRIVLAVFILPLFCQSCLGLSQVESPVPNDPDRFVRVEARYGDANPAGLVRFNHPLELSEREWTRILENVWVRYEPGALALASPKEPSKPAFTQDEIAFLAKRLGRAFRIARPDEWVVFGLRGQRSPELTEITTGGWYVEGDRLNLWLANYRHVVSMASIRQQLWDDPLHSMGDRYYSFAAGDSQTAVLVGGGFLGDVRGTAVPQLIIDYKNFLPPPAVAKPPPAAASPAPPAVVRPAPAASAPAPPVAAPMPPAIAPAPPASARPAPPAVIPAPSVVTPAPRPDAPQPASPPEQGRSSDTANKLRELKQLRDEGVITEEEYRTKKRQLLERY